MKKFLALFLACMLLLCCVGCGGDGEQTTTTTGENVTTTTVGDETEPTDNVTTAEPTDGTSNTTVVSCAHKDLEKATCLKPAVCKACGAEVGEPKGHTFFKGKCLLCKIADPSADGTGVTAISLNKKSAKLTVGSTVNLTAKITPADADKTLTWTSSNPSVAEVDASGEVTAVALGKATITAAAANGVKATCEVQVTSVILTMEEGFPVQGDESSYIELAYNSDYAPKVKTYYAITGVEYQYNDAKRTLKIDVKGFIAYNSQGSPTPTTPSFNWRVVAGNGSVIGEDTWKGNEAGSPPAEYSTSIELNNVEPGQYVLNFLSSFQG